MSRYGKDKFGLSVLMAKRLVEGGVNLVQVNLGKNSSWDTHRRNFVNLKDNLLPPLDRCISALLDDLADSGLLDDTHLRFFTLDSAAELLVRAGWTIRWRSVSLEQPPLIKLPDRWLPVLGRWPSLFAAQGLFEIEPTKGGQP